MYIKIPSLPAAGCTICIHCGSGLGSTIETWSDSFSLPGLFTHYKFEEGAGTDILDATGNGNDAILTPGTGSWDVGGKRVSSIVPDITLDDHSYVFAGDGYAEIPGSDVDPDFQFTKNFTITGWFKSTNADNQMLISKGNIGANHWSVWIWTRFYFRYSAADYYFPPAYLTLVDGGWNFFGVSVDNASVVTVCINGVSFTDPLAQPIVANNSVVRIGSQADGTRGWEGSIDDVQIYHTTPLTADQMRQIYESREFSATEPGAGRTRQIEEENQMGIGRIPIITNYKATELVHLKVNPYGGDPWSMATPVSNFFGNIPVDVDIGVGVPFPLGRIHADQPTADAGIPVVVLDQADLSEGYVDYIGASAASAVGPISSWTTGNTIQGFVRVEVNGVGRWMPYYDDPTS